MPISFFRRVSLFFEVFQDTRHSNKKNPYLYWHAALSCPFMASNYVNWWEFRPRKKIFSSPPPPLFPTPFPTRPPPPPSPETPPPGTLNKKSSPPPSRRLGLPLPLPRAEKKISETSTELCKSVSRSDLVPISFWSRPLLGHFGLATRPQFPISFYNLSCTR